MDLLNMVAFANVFDDNNNNNESKKKKKQLQDII